MTIAITTGRVGPVTRDGRRRTSGAGVVPAQRVRLLSGAVVGALVLLGGGVDRSQPLQASTMPCTTSAVPTALLAKGKNDLLAIVEGPDHTEQIFVFHQTGGHTNVLRSRRPLTLPLPGGGSMPINTLSVHAPAAIIAGLEQPRASR